MKLLIIILLIIYTKKDILFPTCYEIKECGIKGKNEDYFKKN